MPHPIELTDSSGKRPATLQAVVVQTAQIKAVGLFLRSLGLTVEKQTGDDGAAFLTAKCPFLLMKIAPAEKPSDPKETTLHFRVESLDSVLIAVAAQHGKIVKTPFDTQWGRRAIVADADGRRYIIADAGLPSTTSIDFNEGRSTAIVPRRRSSLEDDYTNERAEEYVEEMDDATKADFLKVMTNVKFGVAIVLFGHLIKTMTLIAAHFAELNAAQIRGAPVEYGPPAIFQTGHGRPFWLLTSEFLFFVGFALCVRHKTSRLKFTDIWTAIGFAAVNFVVSLILYLLPRAPLEQLFTALGIVNAAAMALFIYFLIRLMRATENESAANQGDLAFLLYFMFWFVLIGAYFIADRYPHLCAGVARVVRYVGVANALNYYAFLTRVLFASTAELESDSGDDRSPRVSV